jgi:hypothetical protein
MPLKSGMEVSKVYSLKEVKIIKMKKTQMMR